MGLDRGDVGAGARLDTPIQATASPDIAGARNSRRTSSEPNRASAGVAISVCTPIAIGTPPQVMAPSSSAIISA